MSTNWVEIKLGDLGRVVTGKTPPTSEHKYFNGNYNFISPKDMDFDSRYITSSLTTITKEAILKFKNQVLPKNTIMYTALSYGFGKMGIANDTCLTNQQINSIIVDETKYDFNFVYYLLRNSKDYFLTFNAGIVTPIVPKSTFQKIKLIVPKDKVTQQKIGHILSVYDDLIGNNLKRIKVLEEKTQNIYEDWFVRQIICGRQVPTQEYEYQPLEELISEYRNGGWGKEEMEGKYIEEAYVIRGTDIPQLEIGSYDRLPKRFHTVSNLLPRKLKIGDISIEMSNGNINSVGRSFYFDEGIKKQLGIDVICASFCKMLRPKTLEYSYIINAHLKYIHTNNQMLAYKLQAANGINNFRFEGMIHEEIIPLPLGDFMKQLIQQLAVNYKFISNLRTQNHLLKEARNILLPRLMTGIIDVDKIKTPSLKTSNTELESA